MTTTNFNIRIDEGLKSQASEVLAEYGLSPTQAIKMFFSQIVATQAIPLSLDYKNRVPTAKLLRAIAEAESGEVTTYKTLDDFTKAFGDESN